MPLGDSLLKTFTSLLRFGRAKSVNAPMRSAGMRGADSAGAGGTRASRRQILRELPRALKAGEMFLVYQPKLRLRTEEIDAAEALIRWRHPKLGLIPPNVFIPIAEQGGAICDLSLWVLRQAIADQKRLAEHGRTLGFYINIAGPLLTDSRFTDQACALVDGAVGPIGFEITETALIDDPAVALANLNLFADRGIVISIDDYGSGLSSLAYLKQLPASELKIDKLFISSMTNSRRDPLIVRSTIDLAHALDMVVVAEGVETPASLALLRVMGCDTAQGFLISPGLPIDEFEAFLDDGEALERAAGIFPRLDQPESFWKHA